MSEKQIYYQLYQGSPGEFSDTDTPDIDYFTDEPVIQCDVPVKKIISEDDCK